MSDLLTALHSFRSSRPARQHQPGRQRAARHPLGDRASRSSCENLLGLALFVREGRRPAPEQERPVLRPAGTRLSGRDRRRHAGGAGTSAEGELVVTVMPSFGLNGCCRAHAALSRAPSALSRAAGGQSRQCRTCARDWPTSA
ncbi:hypothetical protein P4123_08190 [Pseudomonas aeruginosa]|nr:hypothetical protein [Pseudomonas aeruginosa]